MASGQDCCAPCPEIQVTNIPGSPGATGADGADGINAFTTTAADFIVPACNANVTVAVVENSWMVVGQTLSMPGPAHFEVISLTGTTSAVLKFLCYNGDVSPAVTIVTGSKVSPSGTQPDFTMLPEESFYAVGGSQALTASNVQLLSAVVTLPATGDYLITGSVRIDFSGATTLTSATVFLKLRETTNGPADVPNAVREMATGVVTDADNTLDVASMPGVVYSGTINDTIQLQGSISEVPYVGDVIVVEATILALPIA